MWWDATVIVCIMCEISGASSARFESYCKIMAFGESVFGRIFPASTSSLRLRSRFEESMLDPYNFFSISFPKNTPIAFPFPEVSISQISMRFSYVSESRAIITAFQRRPFQTMTRKVADSNLLAFSYLCINVAHGDLISGLA